MNWAQKVLQIHENEIHHLLARLELPLYLTTNFDSFMVEALKYNLRDKGDPTAPDHRLPPRREGPRWRQAQAGSPQYVLSPEPSPDEPVVFHLNGHDGDPEQQHLILAEDDFLAHLVRISRDQDMIFPSNLLGEIFHEKSFLFLGYHLEDWEFRVILHGFLDREDTELHVAVQLADDQALDTGKAQKYLEDYFGQFSVDIYWGTPQQFVTELHTRWQQYLLETEQDEWDSF